MRFEIVIILITAFLIYNAYHDGTYSRLLLSYKKYYKMAFIGFAALCFYIMVKRNKLRGGFDLSSFTTSFNGVMNNLKEKVMENKFLLSLLNLRQQKFHYREQ